MDEKQLKEILVTARNNKKLTHEQVSVLTNKGISRQYYGMIENGYRRPSVEVAKAIAKVLDIEWTIFFEMNSNQRLRKQAI